MIERMRRLEALMLMGDRNSFLEGLQRLGAVHLESRSRTGEDELLGARLDSLGRSLRWLEALAEEYDVRIPQAPFEGDLEELCARADAARGRMRELEQSIREDRGLAGRLAAWGRFDPEIVRSLERCGLEFAFCSCAVPQFRPEGGESVVVAALEESSGGIHYVALRFKQDTPGELDKQILSFREELPLEDLLDVEARLAEMEEERERTLRAALDDTRYCSALRHAIAQISDVLLRENAESSLEAAADGALCVVRGYFPAAREREVAEFLEAREAAYFVEDPGPEEEVPVSLRQNPFTALFTPILRIFSLPNYHELDTTPFFAPFYTLFFGLCVADVGYGLVMLALLLVVLLRVKNPALRPTLALGFVLSASVVAGGIVLDDYFGIRLWEDQSAAGRFFARLGVFREQGDAMLLPIVLGVVQVCFGYVLRLVNQVRRFGWQGAMLPLGVLCVLYGAVAFAMSAAGPDFAVGPIPVGLLGAGKRVWGPLFAAGLACILLFNGLAQGRKWYLRPLAGLWNLYELATGLPGDILSYLRLFALGLAGGLLAEAVNHIAGTMVRGGGNPFSYLAMAAVLLVGHGLNFGIGLLSAFVHSLRLTFVEFYKAVEFEGGGRPYRAFRVEAGRAPDYSIEPVPSRR